MARSLNKVELIGNLTRDPELRYTPQGTPVCSFGIATNRSWVTDSGEKKEEAEFHRIVAWNKLAELCSQLLTKGRKIYIEGRLANRSWTGQDGAQRNITEIVISDMIILDSRREGQTTEASHDEIPEFVEPPIDETSQVGEEKAKPARNVQAEPKEAASTKSSPSAGSGQAGEPKETEEVNPDDIPF